MSAHTKMHPTKQQRKRKEDSIPWREASKDLITKYTETGMLVRGGRHKADLTQKELAQKIGACRIISAKWSMASVLLVKRWPKN